MNRQSFNLFLTCVFLLTTRMAVFGQFIGDSYKDSKPKGKIDSVVEIMYEFNDNDTTGRRFFDRFVYMFNAKGQVIKSTEHSMDSYFTLVTVYTYDDESYIQQKKIEEKDNRTGTLNPGSMIFYTYSPGYRWVKVDRHWTGKTRPDSPTDFVDAFDLDRSGRILKDSSFYIGTLQMIRRHNYNYNTKGNLVELDDAEGNLGIIPSKTYFTYDDNGNTIKEERMFYRGTYNNIKALMKTYIHSYTYPKLDNKLNWLVKKEYVDGKFERITERHIYYAK
ncbi:MAG: sugar-binding protein [Mucilaginibacter sp.]|nr:sugar-binding protein [Mucilaginibacter sp.]